MYLTNIIITVLNWSKYFNNFDLKNNNKHDFGVFSRSNYDLFISNDILKNLGFGVYLLLKNNIYVTEEQILSAFFMKKNFVEMSTGKGKTIVIFLFSIHCLLSTQKTVFILTFNEYLAERDKKFFDFHAGKYFHSEYINNIYSNDIFIFPKIIGFFDNFGFRRF